MTVFVCGYCGNHNIGARSRDICAASHMQIRPSWFPRTAPREFIGPFCAFPRPVLEIMPDLRP